MNTALTVLLVVAAIPVGLALGVLVLFGGLLLLAVIGMAISEALDRWTR